MTVILTGIPVVMAETDMATTRTAAMAQAVMVGAAMEQTVATEQLAVTVEVATAQMVLIMEAAMVRMAVMAETDMATARTAAMV